MPLLRRVLMGRHLLNLLKRLNKMRGILKPAISAHRLHRISIAQHQAGIGHADPIQIIHVGHSRLGLEAAAEMIFAVACHGGHLFDGNLFCIVLMRPANKLL